MKIGYTAPSIDGQAAAISEAVAISDIESDTISYIILRHILQAQN